MLTHALLEMLNSITVTAQINRTPCSFLAVFRSTMVYRVSSSAVNRMP